MTAGGIVDRDADCTGTDNQISFQRVAGPVTIGTDPLSGATLDLIEALAPNAG